MVRSVNIARTDRLVLEIVKDVLGKIRDRSPDPSDVELSEQPVVDARDGIPSDGITWMSPEHIDMLPDGEKRIIIERMVNRITVHFDSTSNKHRVDVEFSESVSRLSGTVTDERTGAETGRDRDGDSPQDSGGNAGDSVGDCRGKKLE
ncbi:MAG: hypothetical protein RJA99_3795, partial [Pseudomonadota bacterium]